MIGVITGDIVNSGKITPASKAALYADFKEMMTALREEGMVEAFEIFRGDSMKCIIHHLPDALRTGLLIRAWYKSYRTTNEQGASYDIRLSIGIGSVEIFDKTNLGQSDGEAFVLSGHGLDSLKHSHERLVVQCAEPVFNEALAPAVMLLNAVMDKWTGNQAEVVYYKLKNLKEEDIAAKIGISQSAVNQRTRNSRWNAIDALIDWFEKTVKDRLL